ncbi:GNAT family N-acetyltransferase [Nocardioides lacusdianchii]|uniref:GNAT family N-acetyltransferase n=1 Tax=Nocardioides lacusdianchii TaxID=2783664 RepID=UPI0035592A3C
MRVSSGVPACPPSSSARVEARSASAPPRTRAWATGSARWPRRRSDGGASAVPPTSPERASSASGSSPASWRQGLATEGTHALLHHAFVDRGVGHVWAGTSTANTGSRRTLAAVGLSCIDEPFPGVLTYEVTARTWRDRLTPTRSCPAASR